MRRVLALLVLWCAWDSAVSARAEWQVVVSREGRFSVEMPARPMQVTRTRRGPGGAARLISIICTTNSGVYMAVKVELPTRVVRGAEEDSLNAERDELAEQFNGKVISEKRVRAGNRMGRDFTVRGRPAQETGVLTVRAREYLDGNAIYTVAVLAMPNRELPVDCGRFLGSLAIGEGRTRAAGTPEPEPTGRDLPGWGLAIDPDRDCQFLPEGKALTIKTPGTLHDLHPDGGRLNSPRLMRAVEGDFAFKVKVGGDFQPGGTSTSPKSVPFNGAGILIWSDSDNFIRLERAAVSRDGKVSPYVLFEEREGGYPGASHSHGFQGGACYIGVVRKGSRIFGVVSEDGKKWHKLKPIDTVWPARLKVGLSLTNSSSEPLVVKFEEFDLQAAPVSKSAPAAAQAGPAATPPVAPRLPAVKVPLARLDALKGGHGEPMTTKDIARRFSDAVVVIQTEEGSGSGFVVGSEGYILTCAHCVADQAEVQVSYRLREGEQPVSKRTAAKVLAADAEADLALLRIETATGLVPVRLASAPAESGEQVSVIGNPGLGMKILDYTVTEGVVSNPNRDLDGRRLIQTSAQVNPGSSGGPMFNAQGLVLGLVVLKGRIEGAGFAVPADALTRFLVQCANCAGPEAALVREWYDVSGTHRVEAAYLGLSSGAVQLKRGNGKQLAVPVEKLSPPDQEFLRILNPRETK
jgi:serine protease Do